RLMGFGSLPPKLRERAPGLFSEAPHAAVLHAAPVYAAPEQLAGAAVDARSDIHACGALFSEMFCGGLPYAGEDANAVYLAQVQQEPLRPSELWPEVPVALERIILRCIARRPEDRFHDVPQLQQALAELRC